MDQKKLSTQIGSLLRENRWTLVTAESCTGGLVGHLLTNVAGSSDYYLGGVVSYSNALKIALLGVKPATLETFGAVSPETALEMANGARLRLGGDIGVSVTGIAGPGGGTEEKPVGLTFIGVSGPWGASTSRFLWEGDRIQNKKDSALVVFELLYEKLKPT